MRETIPLRKGDKANFEQLKVAFSCGAITLLSAIRKSDGADVALICAMNTVKKTSKAKPVYELVPLAVMCEGNPYEDFDDGARYFKEKRHA
jgi:hypothetical protein